MFRRLLRILFYRLREVKNKSFNPLYRVESLRINSKCLTVYSGTFNKVDKDDAWLAFLLRDTNIFFDVGANVGWVSLLAHVYGTPSRVVLIDPNPLALTLAAGNLIMNDFSSNATLVKSFASDKPEKEVEFFTVGSGAAGSMYASHARTASTLKLSFRVPTTTLDDLSSTLGVVPDLIKIDVEGAESLVLDGAVKICKEKSIRVFVELHSNAQLSMVENASRILKWCETQGYEAWYLAEATKLMTPSQIQHRGRCHVLLLRKGISYPDGLKYIRQGDELPIY